MAVNVLAAAKNAIVTWAAPVPGREATVATRAASAARSAPADIFIGPGREKNTSYPSQ